jgi:hypothetical protein
MLLETVSGQDDEMVTWTLVAAGKTGIPVSVSEKERPGEA